VDYLKLDVEGSEWSVLPDMAAKGELSQLKQLAIEFHLNAGDNSVAFRRKASVVASLYEAGFRVFHTHMYWHGSIPMLLDVYPGPRTICYEVAFVNVNFIPWNSTENSMN
jgi:hypothetical protein